MGIDPEIDVFGAICELQTRMERIEAALCKGDKAGSQRALAEIEIERIVRRKRAKG